MTAARWTRRTVVAGLASVPVLLVAACSGSGGGHTTADPTGATDAATVPGSGSPSASTSASASASAPGDQAEAAALAERITVVPADRARSVAMTAKVEVAVTGGTLTTVTVTGADGRAISGGFDAARTHWTSTGTLASSTAYTVEARARSASGTTAERRTGFATGKPANTFVGTFTPDDGTTVGVGMPVSIVFDHPVADRAAVERAVTVTASPAVPVVGHWFGDSRLDLRPQSYWAAGTKVTLSLRLKDVEGAPGRYGVQSKDVRFTVGRAQTSVVDLDAKTVTVTRDGKVTQRWKVTGGAPGHTTWDGIMVISQKLLTTRMDSETVGLGSQYDIPDVPHAQRLTTSGTFIHGNYWAALSVFGAQNTSHGCIGLHDAQGAGDPDTPAAQFYNSSIVGDVVKVVNSGDRTVAPDNGLNGWNLSWSEWRAGSAL